MADFALLLSDISVHINLRSGEDFLVAEQEAYLLASRTAQRSHARRLRRGRAVGTSLSPAVDASSAEQNLLQISLNQCRMSLHTFPDNTTRSSRIAVAVKSFEVLLLS